MSLEADLAGAIRDVPDFPRPGILFKDISPILADAGLFRRAVEAMAAPFADDGITHVAAIESRGFILGAPLALQLGVAFVPIRKRGKLPAAVERVEYALEYGTDVLEMHRDALLGAERATPRVLVVDDVLATGGTAAAACQLVEQVGGEVAGCSFLLRLGALPGLAAVAARRVWSVLVV